MSNSFFSAWATFIQIMRGHYYSALGNMIEWYDFSLYGYFAFHFSHIFFPASHHGLAMLWVFATYALGLIVRPLGGLLFGHIGDRHGHVQGLRLAVISIALPTVCVGLLPTYQQVGIAAPLLLLLCRIVQGLCAGGQYVGVMTVLSDISPPLQRAVGCSISHVTSLVGYLLAVVVSWVVSHSQSQQAFNAWGWRIPFLLAIFWWLINQLLQNKWRAAHLAQQQRVLALGIPTHRLPLKEVFASHRRGLILATLLSMLLGAMYSSLLVYMISFLQQFVHLPLTDVLLINAACLFVSCLLIPWFSSWADQYGRRPVLMASFAFILISALPCFYLVLHYSLLAIGLAVIWLVIGLTLMIAAAAVTYSELFPLSVRYSGCAFSYNIGVALLGGTSPLILQWLIGWRGQVYWFAAYLMLLALLGLCFVRFLPEMAPIKQAVKRR